MVLGTGLSKTQAQTQSYAKDAKLTAEIKQFEQDADLKNTSWGFYAKSITDGQVLAHYNEEKSLRSASTVKVVTTAAALGILGEDYTFTTILEYDGQIDANGVLQGNLYIRGGGDPTLGVPNDRKKVAPLAKDVLYQWTAAIQKAGIKKIEGYLVGDARFFDEAILTPKALWEDIGNYYGAGASGLTFHENRYQLIFDSSAKTGGSTRIVNVIPKVPNVEFINRVSAGGTKDEAYVYGSPYTKVYHVRGTIPPGKSGYTVMGSAPDPALFCAEALRNELSIYGIIPEKGISTVRILQLENKYTPLQRTTVHTIQSPPLKDIVYWTNKRSINLYAEHLIRMIGKHRFGKGSLENGLKALEEYWKSKGLSMDGFFLYDGSGLSPANAITPKHLTDILYQYTKEPAYAAFKNSLAVAGDPADPGFLKSFMSGTAAAKKMYVKSGFLNNTRAYTGYVYTKNKRLVAFTLIVNNYNCTNSKMKKKMQNLLKVLAEIP